MKSLSLFYICIVLSIFVLIIHILTQNVKNKLINIDKSSSKQCNKHSCGAIDPVSEPDYNMKNVIVQSILLEEHLAEDRKYCKDCCTKHFLHIKGLLEEGLMLAGANVDEYPLMRESIEFYDKQFNTWIHNKEDRNIRLQVCSALREHRKKLMKVYYLSS